MAPKLVCVCNGCATNDLPVSEKGQLFCFPQTDTLRQQWATLLNRPDLLELSYRQILNKGYRVCRLHFADYQFQTPEKKKLNFGQVPLSVLPGDSVEHITLRKPSVIKVLQIRPRNKKMYLRLQITERLLTLSRKRGRRLIEKCRRRKVDILSTSTLDNIENIYSLPRILRIFVLSLLRDFQKTKKIRRYTLEEKYLFLSIMKHSPNCYSFLKKLLSLPVLRTLHEPFDNFKLHAGIDDKLLRCLKSISECMSPLDLNCTLMFGEMKLKNLHSSVGKDTWQVHCFVESGTELGKTFADNVLVFMIRGITKKWKQPVAFYLTPSTVNQNILISLIKEVVRAVHERTKLKIIASVCCYSARNVTALRNLSVESGDQPEKFIYNIDGNQITHLFDAPHLLKCMRNNFITKDIEFEGKVARWTDLQKLYEIDGKSDGFKPTKLTNAHVNPTNRQKMRVKLAAQTFSESTAAFLNILTSVKAMNALGTATFVKFMNDLFDSLNSVTNSAKPLQSKLTDDSCHFSFWDKAVRSLERIKFLSKDKRVVENPPCVNLLIATIDNVQYLWKSLQNSGFKYLTLRSFNQDPVENLFSVVRGLCGNTKPSVLQFVDAYKAAILNNTVKCGVGANCEDDGENLLIRIHLVNGTTIGHLVNPIPST